MMRFALLAALFFCGCAGNKTTPATPPLDASLDKLSFMLGSYSHEKSGVTTSETWIAPGGKVMLGLGSTVKNGQTIFFEYLRVESRDDGIYYIPQPKGAPPTLFKASEILDGKVTFENPQHDFPSRISYERLDTKTIKARIEGTRKGQPAFEEWIYTRR